MLEWTNDYFDPFIGNIGRKNEKRRCCLFTCLTMSAVHIELVLKLDTDSCINAIMRFIARRGKPNTIISDNVTKFVGAEREFAEYVAAWNKEGIEEHLTQRGIRWKFNLPAAPHFSRSMGVVGEKLQESNVCSVGEPNKGLFFKNDIERNTVDSSQFRC